MNDSQTQPENGPKGAAAKNDLLVVGLGASAGGIQALKEFFELVPADSEIAYVVILHLSPDHDSRLAEVLQAVSRIPVTQVNEAVKVAPNNVYVVPPNQHLEMMDGSINVSPNTLVEERRAPVDIFFRTLADTRGESAVAVILSGTGANGSMGIKRVKERGGATFVQNPREAEFNEMPFNAIATGIVDDVLPIAEIPAKIIAYKESLGRVEIHLEAEHRPEEQQQALREIFSQLRLRTGHDFSNYKRPTLLRRIERRITVRSLPSLSAYSDYVLQHPEETQALLKDLLISVTHFFRDRISFAAIERDILPRIIKSKKADQQVRIWVAGCATGEEAYSIAMQCAEQTLGLMDVPKVQIFATDIDDAAIAVAREAIYSLNDAADVSQDRLHRFFSKEAGGYRIRREIRELVLFARHNVLKDPPFSHLDLVACRNMLIYLNRTAQERAMETFHFALDPGGYLFLGTSESADGANDLFVPVDRENHIFQSRHVRARRFPVPESVPTFGLDHLKIRSVSSESENRLLERIGFEDLHRRLLEQFAPPSVVVNEEYAIIHLSENAGRYLRVGGGEISKNLLTLAREEIRLELRTALYQAVQQRTNVVASNLKLKIAGRTETLNLHVRPVLRDGDSTKGFVLIVFEPIPQTEDEERSPVATHEPIARQLEDELMRAKAELSVSTGQYELQAEELKASNEELQAMNEELRSTAEELETSQEELQSINEELRTVNQELKIKIDELSLTTNNLQNLINSTNIATVFLDRSFRVQLFSPAAGGLFNLIASDFGRPLSDITHKLLYHDLNKDVETVLNSLGTVEREVRASEDRVFLMRALPYRTAEDRIEGVVLTFIDITPLKHAEAELVTANEQLETRVSDRTSELQRSNVDLRSENTERQRVEKERMNILRRLVMAQEDERRRIAREMHDQFGQQLTLLSLKLGMLKESCNDRPEQLEQVEALAAVAQQLDADIEFLVWELRPTALDDLGLQTALTDYAQNWSKHFAVPLEVQASGLEPNRLSVEIETALYRIAQEALNNIAKHADATNVNVMLNRRAGSVSLIIEDNGNGFEQDLRSDVTKKGLGLDGMRERAALIGGTVEVESNPGQGTTVIVGVPEPTELDGDDGTSRRDQE